MLRGVLALAAGSTMLGLSPARAQDSQVWTAVTAFGPVASDSRVLAWLDVHARFRESGEALDVTIFRPGVGWRMSDRLDLWVGYARVTTERPGPDVLEHRSWQQATYPLANFWGGALAGRTRIEQRFRGGGADTGWRLRQLFRYARPIDGAPLSLVLQNESFIGLNDTGSGQGAGFDQNRAFVGGAWHIQPRLRLEVGYLNHRLDGGPGRDRTNHNLSIGAFATF